ncbi:hypothetical protein NE619_08785 [Anaerovorax odorimutans]|uniref:Uncharacterized protein n=1 Tax=Anaerovorax odorimutans TaxID=109327 RepID=A0ABT1RNT1_9FIRM|nr:hypothetical protein [Anaerovorax odorimutans]MCQ4636826.1 hypothetical protein [Anaerovorax odorimutans]
MQKISKPDQVIFHIYDNYHKHKKPISILMGVVNAVLFAYYFLLAPFILTPIFTWVTIHEEIWYEIYEVINPFTIGSYTLGAIVLLQYIMYDGWVIKCLLSIFYGWILLMSLVLLMGMTSAWDLCVYIPHLVVIILCGIVTYRKWKRNSPEEPPLWKPNENER